MVQRERAHPADPDSLRPVVHAADGDGDLVVPGHVHRGDGLLSQAQPGRVGQAFERHGAAGHGVRHRGEQPRPRVRGVRGGGVRVERGGVGERGGGDRWQRVCLLPGLRSRRDRPVRGRQRDVLRRDGGELHRQVHAALDGRERRDVGGAGVGPRRGVPRHRGHPDDQRPQGLCRRRVHHGGRVERELHGDVERGGVGERVAEHAERGAVGGREGRGQQHLLWRGGHEHRRGERERADADRYLLQQRRQPRRGRPRRWYQRISRLSLLSHLWRVRGRDRRRQLVEWRRRVELHRSERGRRRGLVGNGGRVWLCDILRYADGLFLADGSADGAGGV